MTGLKDGMSCMRAYITGVHILQEVMYFMKTCLLENKSYRRTCLVGGHILWEDIF